MKHLQACGASCIITRANTREKVVWVVRASARQVARGGTKLIPFPGIRDALIRPGQEGVGMLKEWGSYFIGKWVSAIEDFDRQQSLPV